MFLITFSYIINNVSVDALINLEHNQQELILQKANHVNLVLTSKDVSNVEMELIRAVMSA